MQDTHQDRSLVSLFNELAGEMSTLVRKEVELARVETSEKVSQAGTAIGEVAAAGAVFFAGFLVLLAAAVFLLAETMDLWLAALIVGAIVAGSGWMLLQRGREKLRTQSLMPQRTVDSLRRDKQFAKEQIT